MSNKPLSKSKSEPTPSGPELVKPNKKARKSPDRKYQISWARLQAMDISHQAKQEMITKGIAEPDPNTRRISALPVEARAQAGSMISSVETFNKQHGPLVTARVMFTTLSSKPVEDEPEAKTVDTTAKQ